MFKVARDFFDIATGIEYKSGDTFDIEGVPQDKIEFLSKSTKSRGPLIVDDGEEVEEEVQGV